MARVFPEIPACPACGTTEVAINWSATVTVKLDPLEEIKQTTVWDRRAPEIEYECTCLSDVPQPYRTRIIDYVTLQKPWLPASHWPIILDLDS